MLALFWYRTNSWPVVAVVNGVPVTRFELNQLMYARVGQDAVEDLLMRRIINREIANRKIKVTDGEVAERLNKLKEQIGSEESYKQALAIQGMTEAQLKGQIRIQTALEKMVDPSTDSAKLQQEVGDLVRSLRGKAVVWKVLTGGK
ncbi:MAG: PpiC-type peptidyl-prolyl cis-trans isomerase [Candidatus Amesbacteria bacterium GW2011_GWB1_47_26]|uniref:peptidylprolyl isomerase n=1 Tax=Candidatus Amesbacteria bacterium GW2011_GWC2_45_19 TaxID=1618366 RepID=A0A0G1M346_9BACT|nr:MAG: PpiC-type peptidyl-prolyl cis-trans isomerase [Candidatus Amesbacteria bacterium GW2011_GWC2_45_19]KKU38092.1 MAG: PpiC-type peptidyl-prolyl cis-trans isomerase [Candidatus Amesbacteria bacterium GW2011_GWA1_46_35]KKU69065.1 MAG: PpiC-type peptidyl-prolyl cis-trans isomerase [Microgenomates group bacterium GW2011_GWC1_47_20]KKU74752.1 MAG: PpiC-type peptidyl-prolyl cis-trans isomerase [Candidatus Amesbacteria bacterium GW2011_GWB1_47_26]KKU80183.1 MAG: PpiC-type peptidyl-prolyl cis-tran